jgi:hypothetical protein
MTELHLEPCRSHGSRFAPSGVDNIKDESFVNTKNEVVKRNRPRNLQKISSSLPHVNDFVAFLIFSPSFLQKQFTKQGWYKYKGIRVGNSVAGDFGQPDIAGDFGQPVPCCHSSIKLAGARPSWNWHSRQESEAEVIQIIFS